MELSCLSPQPRCSPSNPAQMTSASNAATKKIRTEYMKKFREPKWETFSKCYQDSVKYRLSRRLMEHTHRPLFGDGWDSGTDSSGRSSPRVKGLTESSNPQPSSSETTETPRVKEQDTDTPEHNTLPVENGYQHVTANGPTEPAVRQRHRAPRSEPSFPQRELDTDESTDSTLRKPIRAKSQPPAGATSNRDNRRSNIRYDWAERSMEARERRRLNMKGSVSAGEIHRADVGVQTRRDSEKRGNALERRRARSANLEKLRRSELSSADDRWITEYMRCFSARLSCCSVNGLDHDETKRLPLCL